MPARVVAALVTAAVAIAACGDTRPLMTPQQGEAMARQCQAETRAPGTYTVRAAQASVSARERIPRVSAVENLGGTSAGAAAINACIERRALGTSSGDATITASETPDRDALLEEARQETRPDIRVTQPNCSEGNGVLYSGADICVGG